MEALTPTKPTKKPALILIIGASGSGKDTAARYLQTRYGCHSTASYTTRPMRQGEEDGREHTFLHWGAVANLPQEWCRHRGLHLLAQTYYGGHYYFTTKEQLLHDDNHPVTYIIDERGYLDLTTHHAAFLEEHFRTEAWLIERPAAKVPCDSSQVSPERLARDAGRISLPAATYTHIIRNTYDLDYLYSVLDALMQRIK